MISSKMLFVEQDPDTTRCKICYEQTRPLISCCECTGTIGFSHQECLKEWLNHIVQRDGPGTVMTCEVCQKPFDVSTQTVRVVFSIRTFISLICSEQYLAGVVGCILTIIISVYEIYLSLQFDLADFTRQIFVPVLMIISAGGWLWAQGFVRRSSTYKTDFVLRPKTRLG